MALNWRHEIYGLWHKVAKRNIRVLTQGGETKYTGLAPAGETKYTGFGTSGETKYTGFGTRWRNDTQQDCTRFRNELWHVDLAYRAANLRCDAHFAVGKEWILKNVQYWVKRRRNIGSLLLSIRLITCKVWSKMI